MMWRKMARTGVLVRLQLALPCAPRQLPHFTTDGCQAHGMRTPHHGGDEAAVDRHGDGDVHRVMRHSHAPGVAHTRATTEWRCGVEGSGVSQGADAAQVESTTRGAMKARAAVTSNGAGYSTAKEG